MDDECMHLNDPALCTICNGKDAASRRTLRTPSPVKPRTVRDAAPRKPAPAAPSAASKRLKRTVVTTTSADTPESVEQYRARYAEDRQDTFDTYVLVFFGTDARSFPGGFQNFARCADADPERKATAPALVSRAERLMRDAGYEADDTGRPQKTRRWYTEG